MRWRRPRAASSGRRADREEAQAARARLADDGQSAAGLRHHRLVRAAAPAGTPKEIVDKLHAATTKALANAEVKEKLAGVGLTPMPMAPADLQKFIVSEITKWTQLTKDAGIEPE